MKLSTEQQIIRYAVAVCEDHRDEYDEINLTSLDEDVYDHFNLTDDKIRDLDVDFIIYKELETRQLL